MISAPTPLERKVIEKKESSNIKHSRKTIYEHSHRSINSAEQIAFRYKKYI